MTETRDRILRALEHGPLYLPFLALVVPEPDLAGALAGLVSDGLVARAAHLGPSTYELTPAASC